MNYKIFEAAASGNVDYLSQIASPEQELKLLTPQENTVLHIAVNSIQKEFAKQVIELCPSLLLKRNKKGNSPLHLAASTGCVELVDLLVSSAKLLGEDVESQGEAVKDWLQMANFEKKETAMHIGLKKGHVPVARLLMDADIGLLDLVTSADESPLYLAVLGGFPNFVEHILRTCPSSKCGGPKGTNAMHAAIYKKDYGIMKILADKSADIIKKADMIGWTPFHYAAYFDNLSAVKILLQFDDSSAAYLSDKDGISPLHIAAFRGKVDIARELIKNCPYIWESLDKKGQTAFHAAVVGGNRRMIEYILEGPDPACWLINEPDEDGNTPLHMAAVCGNVRILTILQNHKGVDKFSMNKELFTAADIFTLKKDKIGSFFYKFFNASKFFLLFLFFQYLSLLLLLMPYLLILYYIGTKCRNILIAKQKEVAQKIKVTAEVAQKIKVTAEVAQKIKDKFGSFNYTFFKVNIDKFFPRVPEDLLEQHGMPIVQIQSWVDTKYRNILKGYHLVTKQENEEDTNGVTVKLEGSDDSSSRMLGSHFIVAVLIASVSFSAVFSMPGGYKSGEGHDIGLPILLDKPGFKIFLGGDMVAFVSSVLAVFILFYCSVIKVNYGPEYLVTNITVLFILMAMLGMIVAFFAAVSLLAAKYIPIAPLGLAIAIFLSFFILIHLFNRRVGQILRDVLSD